MLTFTLTDTFLSSEEQNIFSEYLHSVDADEEVWKIYPCFFKAASRWTKPKVLRVFQQERLIAAAFLLECRRGGRSLFRSPLLYKPIDWCNMPALVWFRFGFGPEVIANPGFFAPDVDAQAIAGEMIDHLRRKALALFITDLKTNISLHKKGREFPYVDEGMVDVSGMKTVQDYINEHRNIKRKIKSFTNKGGVIETHFGSLEEPVQKALRKCCCATMSKSFVRTPFQDAFPDVIQQTLCCDSSSLVHLIAKMKGEIIGYHTFIKTGPTLRMMHGAFNREMKSTFHSYENLIIATVGHAIEQGLKRVYFGPIMNETKRRMMREAEPCAIYYYSCNPVIRLFFSFLYSRSQMQSEKLLAFASGKAQR